MTLIMHWGKRKCLFIPSRPYKRRDTTEMLAKKKEIEVLQSQGMKPVEIKEALGITSAALTMRKRRKGIK